MTEFKDWFTADGRIKPGPGVTRAKAEAVKGLVESSLRGNRIAAGTLVEAVTTSDAAFNLAHVVNVNFLPAFEDAERNWTKIAGRRGVSDFRDAILYTMAATWDDGVLGDGDPHHVSPVVAEGAAYPEAFLRGESIEGARVRKRGFRTGFTFEAFINDTIGFLRALPEEMRRVALDTEEYEVLGTLVNSLDTTNDLAGGKTIDGVTVPANAPLGRAAIAQAKTELRSRTRNGRPIRTGEAFNLLVPVGQGDNARFYVNSLSLNEMTEESGVLRLGVTGFNPLAGISVLETEYLTGGQWALIPALGSTDRPVLEHLYLIGHEAPELRVENLTGNYVGGGAVSPFEGDFVSDQAQFRLRQIGDGVVWSKEYVIWSDGTGS